MSCKHSRWALVASLSGLWYQASAAAEGAPYGDTLAHDWFGLRTYLLDKGVDFRVGLVSELATNVRGGERELWRDSDQWLFSITLDLNRLIGLDAAQFQISITKRDGRNLSSDAHLNSLQEVQGIYGRGQTWRWTQLWYDQHYLTGLLDWKVGRLTGAEDFASFPCEFENLTFCGPPPGNIDINYWYNWPVSQWGTRLRMALRGFGYVQLGAYEVDSEAVQARYGLRLDVPGRAIGALFPFEVGWLPTFGADRDGSYKFGLWYNSSRAPDVSVNTGHQSLTLYGGTPLIHHGQYGGYVNFIQRVTRVADADSSRGVRVFFNATFTDRRTSPLDSQIVLGFLYTGPFASRPADELGGAIGRTHVDNRLSPPQTLAAPNDSRPVSPRGSEYVAELFYGLHVIDGITLRPNVQFVHQPGGIPRTTNDVIVGLLASVDF